METSKAYVSVHPCTPLHSHATWLQKNVLILDNGTALLTDFSCSHLLASNAVYSPFLLGSMRWMAPEGIINEGSITAKTDVWAFAMTILVCSLHLSPFFFTSAFLQELLTGKVPFEEIKSARGIIMRILSEAPSLPDGIKDEWSDLCTPCWDFNPALRPNMINLIHGIEGMGIQIQM